jgi:hypothetical protein
VRLVNNHYTQINLACNSDKNCYPLQSIPVDGWRLTVQIQKFAHLQKYFLRKTFISTVNRQPSTKKYILVVYIFIVPLWCIFYLSGYGTPGSRFTVHGSNSKICSFAKIFFEKNFHINCELWTVNQEKYFSDIYFFIVQL